MYTLLNYNQDDNPQVICKPKMKATDAKSLMEEIHEFIEDGHSKAILELLHKTEYHTDLEELSQWIKNPKGAIHIVTETYKSQWEPIIYQLIRTDDVPEFLSNQANLVRSKSS